MAPATLLPGKEPQLWNLICIYYKWLVCGVNEWDSLTSRGNKGNFFFPHHVQTNSVTHANSYPIGTRGSVVKVKNEWRYSCPPPYVFMVWFLIKQAFLMRYLVQHRFSKWSIPFMHFSSPHVCYMTQPSCSPWFNPSNNTWWSIQEDMTLLTVQIYVKICNLFFKNTPNVYTRYAIAMDTFYQCKGYSMNIKSVTTNIFHHSREGYRWLNGKNFLSISNIMASTR